MQGQVGRLISLGHFGPAENMAIDQVMLESVDATGQPILRVYGWSEPTLSLGYFQRAADRAVHQPSCDLAWVRRATGGGAIVHDHELTYSLAWPRKPSQLGGTASLYQQLHVAVIRTLGQFGITATRFAATDRAPPAKSPFLCFRRRTAEDLIVHGYKVLGSAQRRSRRAILQHGSLILRSSRYAPEVPGILELTGSVLSKSTVATAFAQCVSETFELAWTEQALTQQEWERGRQISEVRFAAARWNGRR